jgi:hypothetical protein
MACFEVRLIDKTECIGNSLTKINKNFEGLQGDPETLGTVCGNDAFIETLRQGIANLNTVILSLSSQTVPGLAKVWGKFNGTRDTTNLVSTSNTDRFIYSRFNISSVYRKALGDYRITFATPFPNSNYTFIGTSSQKASSTGQFTWMQPYTFRTTYVDVRINGSSTLAAADPEHCSIVIF